MKDTPEKTMNNACSTIEDLLGAHVFGELAGQELANVEKHLAACRECQLAVAEMQRAVACLRAELAAESAPVLDAAHRGAIPPRVAESAGGLAGRGAAVKAQMALRFPGLRAVLQVAAVLLVLASLGGLLLPALNKAHDRSALVAEKAAQMNMELGDRLAPFACEDLAEADVFADIASGGSDAAPPEAATPVPAAASRVGADESREDREKSRRRTDGRDAFAADAPADGTLRWYDDADTENTASRNEGLYRNLPTYRKAEAEGKAKAAEFFDTDGDESVRGVPGGTGSASAASAVTDARPEPPRAPRPAAKSADDGKGAGGAGGARASQPVILAPGLAASPSRSSEVNGTPLGGGVTTDGYSHAGTVSVAGTMTTFEVATGPAAAPEKSAADTAGSLTLHKVAAERDREGGQDSLPTSRVLRGEAEETLKDTSGLPPAIQVTGGTGRLFSENGGDEGRTRRELVDQESAQVDKLAADLVVKPGEGAAVGYETAKKDVVASGEVSALSGKKKEETARELRSGVPEDSKDSRLAGRVSETAAPPPPAAATPLPAEPMPEELPVPDSEPLQDATFKQMPVNPYVMTAADRLSTFSLDTDTASYYLAGNYLRHGQLPPPGAIRMEEFVNAFDYNYPQGGEVFNVFAEAAPSPFRRGSTLVKIGVQGKVVGREGRKPAHFVFVIDTSGSMARSDRMPLVLYAMELLLGQLGNEDRLSVITYGTEPRLILDYISEAEREPILRSLRSIQCGGSTNLFGGVKLAYETAVKRFQAGSVNRIVLLSDGATNVGPVAAAELLAQVAVLRRQGIGFTSIGFGMGNYNDEILEALANKGDGNYLFVGSRQEAYQALVEQMSATIQHIAKDAKIQVDFNPDRVRRYRLIGYENRDIADTDFRNDAVDAGEVGSGQSATALYEVELLPAADPAHAPDLGTVYVRYRDLESGQVEEISSRLENDLVRERTPADSPRFFLAACAAEFAELLRQSEHARDGSFADVRHLLEQVAAELPLDNQARALLDLVRKAQALAGK